VIFHAITNSMVGRMIIRLDPSAWSAAYGGTCGTYSHLWLRAERRDVCGATC
jgi:hypothetical protein